MVAVERGETSSLGDVCRGDRQMCTSSLSERFRRPKFLSVTRWGGGGGGVALFPGGGLSTKGVGNREGHKPLDIKTENRMRASRA